MLRDSTVVAAVVRTRPRAIPLAMITMRKSFCFPYMGCLWGSPWRPFGPPELRYHVINAKFRMANILKQQIDSIRLIAERSPISIPYMEIKGNPSVDFLMVILASGIARGRVRTTAAATTTAVESRKMAAILQIIGWQRHEDLVLTLDIHVMINWHLSKQGICWPVSRDNIACSSLQLIEVICFFLR